MRYAVLQAVDMRKLMSFFCVLAVSLAVTSMSDASSGPEVNTESEVAPDNSHSAWTYFHFLNDWAKETEEPDASLDDDVDLQTEEANDTEAISPSEGHRIAGGYETNIRNHPYQVSVRKRLLRKSSYCSGSIISKNWILTAAHCTMGAPSQFRVRAGSSCRRSGGALYRVTGVYRHDDYESKKHDYDIGVMRIDGAFEYNEFVQPIPLATSLPKPGTPVIVAGWGRTSSNGPFSESLLAMKLSVSTPGSCRGCFPYVTSRLFCAEDRDGWGSPCKGDSGGPLACGGVQVGLVQGGKHCSPDLPSLFTSVPYFRDWIRNITEV